MAQRKNGTYVLVMSYNQTDLRYYDPTNGKSVKAAVEYLRAITTIEQFVHNATAN